MSPREEFLDNNLMRKFALGLAVFAVFSFLTFLMVLRDVSATAPVVVPPRKPSSFVKISQAISQIASDVRNPAIFNAMTAANYINHMADEAYTLESQDFAPLGEHELNLFNQNVESLIDSLFSTRIFLAEALKSFEAKGQWSENEKSDTVAAFRRGQLYLRYAEDYAIEILNQTHPLKGSAVFFEGAKPLTLVNPKYADPRNSALQAGDIILVRGSSFFSATIARVGDVPTNLSHIAMVAERPDGSLYVVEALLEKGLISYPLADYLKLEPLPRAAVYRFYSPEKARAAARELWKMYAGNLKHPIPFDIFMDPDDHDKIYCAEAMAMAFARTDGNLASVPRYRTQFSGISGTEFAKATGLTAKEIFAPADIEVDTRFTLVKEHRDLNLLAKSRRYDVVLSKLFDKFKAGYTYKRDVAASVEGGFAVMARSFGFLKSVVPAGMDVPTFSALLRHKKLVEKLMTDLAVAENQVMLTTGRPVSYRELEDLFDKTCGDRCVQAKSEGGFGRLKNHRAKGADLRECELLFKAKN